MTPYEKREKSRQMRKFTRKMSFIIVVAFFGVLLLLLLAGGIYNASLNKVKTEVAYKMTRESIIEADGYAFRNETVIQSNETGICTYNANDGDRVSKGFPVANVYATAEQATRVEQINELNDSAEALKELQTASIDTGTNPELLNKQIEEYMFDLLGDLNSGNISEIDSIRSTLAYSMSKYNIVTKNETDFNEEIGVLEAKISELKSGLSQEYKTIKAPAAGYYVSTVDGYENILRASDVKYLTLGVFEEKIGQRENAVSNTGKIVTDYDWYLVCAVSTDQGYEVRKKLGSSVRIVLPYTSEGKFSASVVRVDINPDEGKALVVLKCSNMSKTLASFRHQKLKIVLNTHTGLFVNPKAIRTETVKCNVTGIDEDGKPYEKIGDVPLRYVYVDAGKVTRKRYVEITYEDFASETAICRMVSNEYEEIMKDPIENKRRNYLDIYDKVIVEGVDLSDGKIIR